MKQIITLTVGLLLAFAAWGQAPQTEHRDYAVVSSKYDKEYEPDEIYMQIVIRERDSKGKISIEEQQQAMSKVLTEQGLDIQKLLKVKNISSSFYKKGQNLAFGGYELKLKTPAEFHAVFTALDDLGISEVTLLRINRSDREKLQLEVIAEAMKSARSKAEAIAATEGLKVGKCIYFKDDITTSQPPEYLNERAAGIYVMRSSQPDKKFTLPEIGTVKISGGVEAKFLLE